MMWGWNGGPGWWPMWGFGWVMPVLFLVAIFLMVRFLRTPRADAAGGILRERYAKGEITKEQFDTLRKDLGV